MRNLITILYTLLLVICGYSQESNKWIEIDAKEYLSAIIKLEDGIPSSESYFLQTTSSVFSDYESLVPVQKSAMELKCKDGHFFNIHANGLIILQDKGLNVTIDSAHQEIYIKQEDDKFTYRKQSDDFVQLAEMAKHFYKVEKGELTTFYLEFINGYEIKAIELTVNKSEFKKMVYYSSSSLDYFEYPDQLARFELSVDIFKTGKKSIEGKLLHPSDVVSIVTESVVLQPAFSHYTLIDLR